MLAAIQRIVRGECQAAGSPRDPDFETLDSFPLTDNDPGTTSRVAAAFGAHFGDRAMAWDQQTASEDFRDIPRGRHSLHLLGPRGHRPPAASHQHLRRPAADKRRRAHRPSDEQPAHPGSAAGSPASHAESGAATRRAPPGASPSSPYGSCRSGWRRCRCAPRTAPGRTPPSRHWASLYEPAPAAHRRSRPALAQAARPAAGSAPASSAGAHSLPADAPAPRPQPRESQSRPRHTQPAAT